MKGKANGINPDNSLKKQWQKALNKDKSKKSKRATLKIVPKRRIVTDSDDAEISKENEATLEKFNN